MNHAEHPSLYIYYRSRAAVASAVVEVVRAAHREMRDVHAIEGEFLRKADRAESDTITWMEVYRNVDAEQFDLIERTIARAGLLTHIDGGRHMEWFEDVTSCA